VPKISTKYHGILKNYETFPIVTVRAFQPRFWAKMSSAEDFEKNAKDFGNLQKRIEGLTARHESLMRRAHESAKKSDEREVSRTVINKHAAAGGCRDLLHQGSDLTPVGRLNPCSFGVE